jgi:hypothetical protein
MSVQRLPQQHPDHLIARPDPLRETEVVDLAQQAFGQPKVDRLLGYRFCCHCTGTTGIIEPSHASGTSIIYTNDAVNDIARPPRGKFP